MKVSKTITRSTSWIGLVLLSVFITLIYSNTFKAAWQFDDYPNIIQNPTVHIDNLAPVDPLQDLL